MLSAWQGLRISSEIIGFCNAVLLVFRTDKFKSSLPCVWVPIVIRDRCRRLMGQKIFDKVVQVFEQVFESNAVVVRLQ